MIYRLSYVSTVAYAAAAQLNSTVEDILIVSVANNLRDDITGFLLCDGERFAQALEGPSELVEACFDRIVKDDRNVEPLVRERGPVRARSFARWSMCGLTLSDRDDLLLHPPDIEFDLASISKDALWQHLVGVAERHASELDAEHEWLLDLATGKASLSDRR
jgi:Sensors of blue-light using FAD